MSDDRRCLYWFCGCRGESERVTYADDLDAAKSAMFRLGQACDLAAAASATMRDESIAKDERILELERAMRTALDCLEYGEYLLKNQRVAETIFEVKSILEQE
jgi:hypothetical protein